MGPAGVGRVGALACEIPSSGRSNSSAAAHELDCVGGQHLEGDWAALDLPLRIPQERGVLRHKAGKAGKRDGADKTFRCSANVDAAKRAAEVQGGPKCII